MAKPYREMSQHERDARNSARWKTLRRQILDESDQCWICGHHGADTIDHIIPLSQGGTNERWNLRPAHGRKRPDLGCEGNYARGNGTRRRTDSAQTSRRW